MVSIFPKNRAKYTNENRSKALSLVRLKNPRQFVIEFLVKSSEKHEQIINFPKFSQSLDIYKENILFPEFWEHHFSCKYPNSSKTPYNIRYTTSCTGREKLTEDNTVFEDQLQFVSDAVMAFAYAIRWVSSLKTGYSLKAHLFINLLGKFEQVCSTWPEIKPIHKSCGEIRNFERCPTIRYLLYGFQFQAVFFFRHEAFRQSEMPPMTKGNTEPDVSIFGWKMNSDSHFPAKTGAILELNVSF